MDALTYTSNETISELFLNLLASASSTDTCNSAHPSFIHIITSLSVDEAKIVNLLFQKKMVDFPFIYFRAYRDNDTRYTQSEKHLTALEYRTDLLYPEKIDLYLDNLVTLGLFRIHPDKYITRHESVIEILKESYKDEKEEFQKMVDSMQGEFSDIKIQTGYYELSTTGKEFMSACVTHED
ncbi:DUF4393 domain-containing protein [Paenibacillus algicola]|nr:DUF4393 domain-containing protein [Paenibacillus algicola]